MEVTNDKRRNAETRKRNKQQVRSRTARRRRKDRAGDCGFSDTGHYYDSQQRPLGGREWSVPKIGHVSSRGSKENRIEEDQRGESPVDGHGRDNECAVYR